MTTNHRPVLVFPQATPRGGVEQAVWQALKFLGARHDTAFVGYVIDQPEGVDVMHIVPEAPSWARGALAPVGFRISARAALPRDQRSTVVSFGANAPAGDVLVVNSLHRSWLHVGKPVTLRGVTAPNATRYLLPRHQILLGLEWTYFRSQRPKAVIAVSDVVAEQLADVYGVSSEIIHVVHNGYDPVICDPRRRAALRRSRREQLQIADDAIVLLFVANELHRKGLGVLLDAVARAGDERLEIHIVGRTAPDDYLQQIESLGLGQRVAYHGATHDIGLYHAIGDILVLPTQYEAFALTIVEALASGLPVITTSVPGAGDLIVPGVNGLLQRDPTDTGELATCLRAALDGATRERWSREAPRTVAHHDWPTLMAEYERIIFDVAATDTFGSLR
jgi:UDP-glucose:(heptosyl)LPS alpha-1,3-glucosyltransferase